MLEFIAQRRNAEKKEERDDLLTNFVEASFDDPTLTDRDVTGNIFIFLFAGHEVYKYSFNFSFCVFIGFL